MSLPASDTIVRHLHPLTREPWAREFAEAIEIPPGAHQLFLCGVGPSVANPDAPPDTVESYGDTATQTLAVIRKIEDTLARRGYGLGDIVQMQALIVGDPNQGGQPDFDGFSQVYNQFFGTAAQPHVPARTRAQVERLVPPGWLVEITVMAARVVS